MAEVEAIREREAEPGTPGYEIVFQRWAQLREQCANGQVVVRGREQQWQNDRQGRHKMLLWPANWDKTCVTNWILFTKDINTSKEGVTNSGEHRHQGGLGLFAIEGEGWTTVDGVRHDWKAGDFIMLPIKTQGCIHQHFAKPGTNAKWVAFVWEPYSTITGSELEHRKVSILVS